MLYSIDSESYVTNVPHQAQFEKWKSRLSPAEFASIVDELNARVEGGEIHTSSWIPGSDWRGTVFQVIYEKACGRSQEAAAKFFGLILWSALLDRDDVWGFGRYEKDGVPIEGMTYFRLEHAP